MPEWNIESLGVMGWGLVVAENSPFVAAVAAAIPAAGWGNTVVFTILDCSY